MTDLIATLGEAVAAAFAASGLGPEHGRVTASDRPDLADFQCNGALAAAKAAGRNPREIAGEVAERLGGDPLFSSVEVAGPGFINLRVSDAALMARAAEIAGEPNLGLTLVGDPRRVIVDYGGPNVAKPMHVGHLRASIIGESLKRLYRRRGDEVLGDAHFGDWGFQMGLLIVAAGDENPLWRAVGEELRRTRPRPWPTWISPLWTGSIPWPRRKPRTTRSIATAPVARPLSCRQERQAIWPSGGVSLR